MVKNGGQNRVFIQLRGGGWNWNKVAKNGGQNRLFCYLIRVCTLFLKELGFAHDYPFYNNRHICFKNIAFFY